MRKLIRTYRFVPIAPLALGLSAYSVLTSQQTPAPQVSAAHHVQEMSRTWTQMDSAMMRRHMREADSMMVRVRADVAEMRRLSPEKWPAHLPEHLAVVDSLLSMMRRHMREAGRAMHPNMGARMGMDAAMHRRMRAEMEALQADVEVLRRASPAGVRERMPAHLERLEQMLKMMQQMHARMQGR